MTPHVVVIGGGICGLVCAHRLQQQGVSVQLLESSGRPGGVIATVRENGYLIEKGPQSFLGAESVMELVRVLGLGNEILTADARAPRYVLLGGCLRKVPMSPQAILASSFLSAGSRWRILSEPFRKSVPPAAEESVAQFVRRKFGHEILDYLVTPFVSGVYAGDAEMLSLKSAFPSLDEWERKHGSVVRGAMKSRPAKGKLRPALCTFRNGMSAFTVALSGKLGGSFFPGASAHTIEPSHIAGKPQFKIAFSEGGKLASQSAAAVVLATPAYITGNLLGNLSERLKSRLTGIAYAPVALVALGYRTSQVKVQLEGFGFLIPRRENRKTLGTVCNSWLFPGRAPEGHTLLTSFLGGATDPALAGQPEEFLTQVVRHELEDILRIAGPPQEQFVWRWPKALPQYNLRHAQILDDIRNEVSRLPGIFLTGNFLEGPSIGNCVEHAAHTADAVREFLRKADS